MRENSCSICGEKTNAKPRLCYIYLCWDCYKEQKGISEAFRIDEEIGKFMEKQIKKNKKQKVKQLQFGLARKFSDDKIPARKRIVQWGKVNSNIRVHDKMGVKYFYWTADVNKSKKWRGTRR